MRPRALRGPLATAALAPLAAFVACLPACSDVGSAGWLDPPDAATEAPPPPGLPDGAPQADDAGPWSATEGATPLQDAAGLDASIPGDGPAGGSGCAGAVVCDDFEQDVAGQPPGAPFAVSTPSCSGAGVIAVDATQAHSGSRSVKVTGGGGYCDHVFFGTPLPAQLGSAVVWARFFVRLDAALGTSHVTFLAMHDASEGKDLRMGGQDQVLMWNRESDDATLPAMSPAGTAQSLPAPTMRWTCVELAVDTGARTIRTWVDGALVPGLVDDGVPTPDVDAQWLQQDPSWSPRLVDVRFGWESYAGQADTLWFDDVAIAAARVGCGT
jgi:hypothetical protein